MVERFFRDLTKNRLRRGAFRSVEERIEAIGEYIDHHNESQTVHLDRQSGPHPGEGQVRPRCAA